MTDWTTVRSGDPSVLHFAILTQLADIDPLVDMMQVGLRAGEVACQGHGIQVEPTDFEPCIRSLTSAGFRGVLALSGHKVEAARLGERFFVAKNSVGVANALSFQGDRIYAQNTEVPAIGHLIKDLEPAKALVLGSGAAARSVVMALFEAGWRVRLWNRSAMKARPMLALFARFGKIELVYQPDPAECRLVVNCTPLGAKAGECPPLEWGHVRPKTVFLDMVNRRVPTEFLRNAANRGLRAIEAREVIVESGALALEWWTGKALDRIPMRESVGLH